MQLLNPKLIAAETNNMSTAYNTVLLFGAPGAGKGTQGKILGQIPGFFHLSCGEVFRTIDVSSDLGRLFAEHSSKGELVPDEVTVGMWKQNLHAQTVLSLYKPTVDLLILDGIPRNTEQAGLVKDTIEVLKVVHLICTDKEEMIRRLTRRALKENRADDAREETIRKRWDVFERETLPVLEFYADRGTPIAEVDAVGSPGAILQQILEEVVPVQESHFQNPEAGTDEDGPPL